MYNGDHLEGSMSKTVIRPTALFVRASFLLCLGIWAGVLILWYGHYRDYTPKVLLLPAVLMLWPAALEVRRRFTRLILEDDAIHYETGVLTKTTRSLELSAIVDVRTHQNLFGRIADLGTLTIQPNGEAEPIELRNVERPRDAAKQILDGIRAHRGMRG